MKKFELLSKNVFASFFFRTTFNMAGHKSDDLANNAGIVENSGGIGGEFINAL